MADLDAARRNFLRTWAITTVEISLSVGRSEPPYNTKSAVFCGNGHSNNEFDPFSRLATTRERHERHTDTHTHTHTHTHNPQD